jgi:hypothetical protein
MLVKAKGTTSNRAGTHRLILPFDFSIRFGASSPNVLFIITAS